MLSLSIPPFCFGGRTSGERLRHAAASLPQGLQDSVGMRQAVGDSVDVTDK